MVWTASAGTIANDGLFTAPSQPGQVTVTATESQDGGTAASATISVQSSAPPATHVVLVVEENSSYSTVVGDTAAWPNLNTLALQGASVSNYYADTHPSIGNYLMLVTGQVLTNDDTSTQIWSVDNIARRMLAANVSFKVYAEGITQGYTGGDTGQYVIRHNPLALLSDVVNYQQIAKSAIAPFTAFASDLASGTLPDVSLIIPGLNDDAHDGTPQQADQWLQDNVVVPLSSNSVFQSGGDGTLVVTFDEAATSDTTHGGGHIPCVLWGPTVRSGYRQMSSTVYQHESLLATWTELVGLSSPPAAAANAPLMNEFLVRP